MSMKKEITGVATLDRSQKDFLLLLGYNYLKCNKIKDAIVIYKALYYLFPEEEVFSLCLSFLYLQIKEYEDAILYAEIYLKREGNLKHGRLIKSKVLFELGLVEEAKECAQKILAK